MMARGVVVAILAVGVFSLSVPARGQRAPAPAFDSVKKLGPPKRLANGRPDLSGVYFPGAVPDTDHYAQDAAAHRTFDPKATPQEPPSFQPWATEKIKLMGNLELVNPELQCAPLGALGYFFKGGYPISLVQTPEQLVVLGELLSSFRVVYTDGRPQEKDPEPLFNGTSVGRWEGDTLVADLIGLDTRTWLGPARGWFPSDVLHATERFSRDDASMLTYQVTVDDPKVLTKPWVSVPRKFTWAPKKRIYEYYCTDNQDYEQLGSASAQKSKTLEGADERFFDEQEYRRMKAPNPERGEK